MRLRTLVVTGFALISTSFDAVYAQTNNDDNARIARLQAQILELEQQIRILTGRLEEAEFFQRRTDQRLDRLIGDVDVRLRGLEVGSQIQAIDEPPQDQALPTVSAATENQIDQSIQPGIPQEEGVLGTIPRDALLGVQRPGADPDGASVAQTSDATGSDPAARYRRIQELLANSQTAEARSAIESYLGDFADDDRAPQLAFLLGETWFLDGLYANSAQQFAENVRLFGSDDPRAPDNLLKLGMSLARIGDPERACTAFVEFERRYPRASTALLQTAQRERQAANCP